MSNTSHSLGQIICATKCANTSHTGDSKSFQQGDKAPLRPDISWGEGGGGFTLTGEEDDGIFV